MLIAIGEENKKISEDIKKDYSFKWNDISKMRDKISHNYRGVNSYWNVPYELYILRLKNGICPTCNIKTIDMEEYFKKYPEELDDV